MLPDEIKDSCEKTKLIWMILSIEYSATVEQISKSLGLYKLEILPLIRKLLSKGLIEEIESSTKRYRLT